jgi:hypothetical protein
VEEKNKEDENEQDMVPNFAETYEALEKVRAFFYAHSVTDEDRERILGLEKSYFQLRQNSAMKQKTMYDFFRLKSGFSDFSFSHIFRSFTPLPSKTKNREVTVFKVLNIIAQWARIPKKLTKNRYDDIKQLRRNPLAFVWTSSLVTAYAWTSLCLYIGHICTAG